MFPSCFSGFKTFSLLFQWSDYVHDYEYYDFVDYLALSVVSLEVMLFPAAPSTLGAEIEALIFWWNHLLVPFYF